jgi:pimeloyl-ACP methyl ester carboxylesterase
VIVDPRGAGLATPNFACTESVPVMRRTLAEDLPLEAEAKLWAGAARACAARLRAGGATLEAYDTRRAAADLEALRRALGYDQWNLWGTSYGARLALVFAREYPGSVRTLVLDSPDAPDADVADQPANFQRVLGELFRRCARSPRCRRDAPDPAGALDRLLARLDRQPLRLEVASPIDLRPVPVLVTPEHLLEAIFNALYDASRAHEIPLVLTAADRGSLDLLAALMREYVWMLLDPRFADGLFDVIACRELLAHGDLDRLEREAAAHPWRRAFVGTAALTRAACSGWGVAPVPAEALRPVTWPGPALVLAGGLDPIIPPADARRTAAALPGGRLLEFAATGHAVEYHLWSCVDDLIAGFVRTPAEPFLESSVQACRAEAEAVEFWTLYPAVTLPPRPLDPALERAASLARPVRRR